MCAIDGPEQPSSWLPSHLSGTVPVSRVIRVIRDMTVIRIVMIIRIIRVVGVDLDFL